MRDLVETVCLIGRHLSEDGWYDESLDVYLANPRRPGLTLESRHVKLLAGYRTLMLQLGYPVETVAGYDR